VENKARTSIARAQIHHQEEWSKTRKKQNKTGAMDWPFLVKGQ
jgi:hypothetical protein